MVGTIILLAGLAPLPTMDLGAKFQLTESTRSESKITVTQQGFGGTMTESSTAVASKWTVQIDMPFSADDWANLGQNGELSLKVGNQVIEKRITSEDGFDPKSNRFSFRLSKAVVPFTGFQYLKKASDPPPSPAPAPGTRLVFATGSMEFHDAQLKITLSSSGNAAPSLVGENFVSLGDGKFEGKLPLELDVAHRTQRGDLAIYGTLKRRTTSGTDTNGSVVQLSLTGKA